MYRGVTPKEGDSISANSDSLQGLDTDADGLPDFLEMQIQTNPDDAATDDDGIVDGDEDENHNGIADGEEDKNKNGRVDPGERDPNRFNARAMPWIPLLLGD